MIRHQEGGVVASATSCSTRFASISVAISPNANPMRRAVTAGVLETTSVIFATTGRCAAGTTRPVTVRPGELQLDMDSFAEQNFLEVSRPVLEHDRRYS